MPFTPEARATILQRMVNHVVSRSSLTDLTKTSQLFRPLVAMARGIEKIQHAMEDLLEETDLDKATGVELDERAKRLNPNLLARITKVKATSTVVFSRAGTVGAISIVTGSQVKVPAGTVDNEKDLIFVTTAGGTIANGFQDSAAVAVVAAEPGAEYNVDPGTINGFVTKPPGVDTVQNASAVTSGRDLETDDDFRERIRGYKKSLTRATVSAIEGILINVTEATSGKTVMSASVVEDLFNPGNVIAYIDDGAGTAIGTPTAVVDQSVIASAVGGEMDIYLPNSPMVDTAAVALKINTVLVASSKYDLNYAGGHFKLKIADYPTGLTTADAVTCSYTYHDTFITEAQKVVDGDPADRANYPGYRAAGVLVAVKAPQILLQTVTANITFMSNFNPTTVKTSAVAAINRYLDSLRMGEDVIRHEVVQRIMAVPGVFDVQLSSPSGNVIVSDNQLARSSVTTVT